MDGEEEHFVYAKARDDPESLDVEITEDGDELLKSEIRIPGIPFRLRSDKSIQKEMKKIRSRYKTLADELNSDRRVKKRKGQVKEIPGLLAGEKIGQATPEGETLDTELYQALSHPRDPLVGTEPDPSIYRRWGEPVVGDWTWRDSKTERDFKIRYTLMGDAGPVVLFLHGVPTNRKQWYSVQRRLAPFFRTISIDMLGMGESDKPTDYATAKTNFEFWKWKYDVPYVRGLMGDMFRGQRFHFVTDDWGCAILLKFAELYPGELLTQIYLDPVAFDGHPVAEIQAIGRGATIEDKDQFEAAFGTFDQTLVQILKTMTYDMNVWNQYSLRDIKGTYVDVDYERPNGFVGPGATSQTMELHFDAIRVLAQRAAILSPNLLLPYDSELNPEGVRYSRITVPYTLVLWGEFDNMMPETQRERFANAMVNSEVHTRKIPRAGHFAGVDQPDLVAEAIIDFIRAEYGVNSLADIFLGYTGIWKGDERALQRDLRIIHGMPSESGVVGAAAPTEQRIPNNNHDVPAPAPPPPGRLPQGLPRLTIMRNARRTSLIPPLYEFRTFVRAVDRAGLSGVLDGPGPLTVFAPTNRAFQRAGYVNLSAVPKDELSDLLKFHIVQRNATEVVGRTTNVDTMLRGERLQASVTERGRLSIQEFGAGPAMRIRRGAVSSNGDMFRIERVLMPSGRNGYSSIRSEKKTSADGLARPRISLAGLDIGVRPVGENFLWQATENSSRELGYPPEDRATPVGDFRMVRDILRLYVREQEIAGMDSKARKEKFAELVAEHGLNTILWRIMGHRQRSVPAAADGQKPIGQAYLTQQEADDILRAFHYTDERIDRMTRDERMSAAYRLFASHGQEEVWRRVREYRGPAVSSSLPKQKPIGQLSQQTADEVLRAFDYTEEHIDRMTRDERIRAAFGLFARHGPDEVWRRVRELRGGAVSSSLPKQKPIGQLSVQTADEVLRAFDYTDERIDRMTRDERIRAAFALFADHGQEEVWRRVREYRGPAVSSSLPKQKPIGQLEQRIADDMLRAFGYTPRQLDRMTRDERISAAYRLLAEYGQEAVWARVDQFRGPPAGTAEPSSVLHAAGGSWWDIRDQYHVLPPVLYRTAWDPQEPPENKDTYERTMWDHIDLTIIYVEAAGRKESDDTQQGAVKDLIEQFDVWVRKFDEAGLSGEDWRPIILEHTVAAKALSDSYYAGDKDGAANALAKLRENAKRVKTYLKPLKSKAGPGQWGDLNGFWMTHLRCTASYMKLAAKTNLRHSTYEHAQRLCLAFGMEFGALLDKLLAAPTTTTDSAIPKPKGVGDFFWDAARGFIRMPSVRYRSSPNPEREPPAKNVYERLMWKQVDLSIAYSDSLARASSDDTRAGAERDLIEQIDDWTKAMEGSGLDAEQWQTLAKAHALDETRLGDAIFAEDREAKQQTWKELKTNAKEIVEFLNPLTTGASGEEVEDVSFLWMMHIRCTKQYMKLAKAFGQYDKRYEYAQRVCLAYGMELGALMDRFIAS